MPTVKDTHTNEEQQLPPEVVKEIFQEQKEFTDNVFEYELPKVLDDISQPLTMREKKQLKEFDLQQIDTIDNFDDVLFKLAEMRGLDEDALDSQSYADLCIWVRQVVYGTFNLRHAVKK